MTRAYQWLTSRAKRRIRAKVEDGVPRRIQGHTTRSIIAMLATVVVLCVCKHPEFPVAQPVLADEVWPLALGKLATRRYSVTGTDGAVRTLRFAPSPPARNAVEQGGVLIIEMQMNSREV